MISVCLLSESTPSIALHHFAKPASRIGFLDPPQTEHVKAIAPFREAQSLSRHQT